ncbi:DegT/DnrJ/EryC1/StrS family aminotransferase [Aeromonas salmonicida]
MYNKIPSSSPHNLINANSLSSSVICLPLYPGLDSDSITRIIALIKNIHG